MPQFGQFWRKVMFLLQRKRLERELDEEMRLHAQLKTEKNLAAGMDEQEARFAAQRQLGNATLQREESRQSWGFPLAESVAQDIRYGLRGLRKSPAFTTVAIITLGLGIGAATAIFSIVNAVLLRPLPYKDSSRIVNVFTVSSMFPEFHMGQSAPNLADIKARAQSFETIATYQLRSQTITGAGEPEQIMAAAVSANFLDLFSIHPTLGRPFVADDEQQKDGNVALISDQLWKRRFGGDTGVVRRTITLDQKPYTVIGILPAGFEYPPSFGHDDKTEIWIPLVLRPEDQRNRTSWGLFTLAKLRPGVPVSKAQAEMDGIAAAIAHQYPKDAAGIQFPVTTIQAWTVQSGKRELLVLLGAVGFLLLIACANVSNLVLSRGLQRQREIAVRAALGANRRRILRQLFLETVLLSLFGGAAGLGLAVIGLRAFRAFAPAQFPRLQEIELDPAIALFAFLLSGLAAVLCGLIPALFSSRSDLNITIKENVPAAPQIRGFSFRGFLVVTEVALTLILLTGSALMVESMVRLLKVDPGLRTDHMLTAEVTLSSTKYDSEEAQRLFMKQMFDSLRAQPQFSRVALSNNSILNHSTALLVFDPSTLGINEKQTNLESRSVSPGYFETMGIPLLRGRSFKDRDVHGSANVVVINQSLARRFFPGQDPIGKMIKFSKDSKEQYQIVGVASDTRDIHLSAGPRPQIYFSVLQEAYNGVHVLVRSRLDPAAATSLLQKCVWSVDKDQPLRKVLSMSQVISGSIAEPRFRTWLLTAFAVVGLSLTLIGIYGVISYSVSQRTHEMGIRIALGAQPENVRRLVLSHGIRLTLLGGVAGVLGSLLLTRLLQSQLYETKPGDPATLAGAAVLMLLVALGASYIPARRATRVDPMVALRYE